jgi:hypothetical protein
MRYKKKMTDCYHGYSEEDNIYIGYGGMQENRYIPRYSPNEEERRYVPGYNYSAREQQVSSLFV